MNRLAKMIGRLGREELLLLQKDLDSGNIERLIAQRLAETSEHDKICPVCGSGVDKRTALRIEFGPPDLRKQAYFDAPDCLQFFITESMRD